MSKKILITGKNSYIGKSFIRWMSEFDPSTECTEISVRGNEWKLLDFSRYDSILHVAGIAHVNSTKFSDDDYYKVNTRLSIDIAEKAKKDGVTHFIFMSSIIVYNDSNINSGMVTKDTVPFSKNAYGDSKIKAENGIAYLADNTFKITILRPPMIYGPNSKGNFSKLSKLARSTPVFPAYTNKRSMLFVDNLSSFIRYSINNKLDGIYFPQNSRYSCTSDLVLTISELSNRRVILIPKLNFIIKKLLRYSKIKKIFGDLYYASDICEIRFDEYEVCGFRESIKLTEGLKLFD